MDKEGYIVNKTCNLMTVKKTTSRCGLFEFFTTY